jgi:hypothetical protein
MISDRGTFSAGHAARLAGHGYHALCSVPWGDYRGLYDAHESRLHWQEASYLSIEQRRRRDTGSALPREHYEIAVLDHPLTDPDSGAAIPGRVIFVYSSADEAVCRQTRRRDLDRLRAGLEAIAAAVRRGHPRTKMDNLPRRVATLLGTRSAARHVRWELRELTVRERAALPVPGRGCRRAAYEFVYHIDEAAAAADARYDGLSALVTTAPLSRSGDVLFTMFKEQNFLESGHHQFKTPLAVSPVFLKSPRRVEALVCLLQIALQAYQMVERLYRISVPEDAPAGERRMTTETLLRAFTVQGVLVETTPVGRVVHATRPTSRQRKILTQLGLPTPTRYLAQCLPPVPTG